MTTATARASATAHPVEHLLVAFAFLLEGACWIINEALGFHNHAPKPMPHIQPVHSAPTMAEQFGAMTVKRLKAIAKLEGITIKPKMLKRELQQALFAHATMSEALV